MALASAAALRLRNIAFAEETARRRLSTASWSWPTTSRWRCCRKRSPTSARSRWRRAAARALGRGGPLRRLADGDRVWLMIGDVSGKGVGAPSSWPYEVPLPRDSAGSPSVAAAVSHQPRAGARQRPRDVRDRLRRAPRPRDGPARVCERGPQPALSAGGGRCRRTARDPVDPALGAVEVPRLPVDPAPPRPRRYRAALHRRTPGGAQRGERKGSRRWGSRPGMSRRSSTRSSSPRRSRVSAEKRPSARPRPPRADRRVRRRRAAVRRRDHPVWRGTWNATDDPELAGLFVCPRFVLK